MKAGQGKRRAALYARYSTDKQSEMSVEDQFRVSECIANCEGFEVVAVVEINEAEAVVVRRIFDMYASGLSPRSIAARLNAEGVPSPGASWSRKSSGRNSKRRCKWVTGAIHGNVRRGSGILNNERYIGRMTWGRSRWKRGAADSFKRVNLLVEDRSQWVTQEEPRLRIIPDDLWNRVRERQAIMAAGAVRIRAARTGRPATSLLSGLLVCASCGSRFIAVDQFFYGCASLKQGGLAACTNTARLRRVTLEQRILAEIEAEILSDEALERVKQGLQSIFGRVVSNEQERSASPKLAKLEEEAQELCTLVKKGRLSSVPAQAALDAIERERAEFVFRASRDERRVYEEAMKAIPQSAALYRAAVREGIQHSKTRPNARKRERSSQSCWDGR